MVTNSPDKKNTHTILPLIAMCYMVGILLADVFVNRMIGSNHWYTSGAAIGFPLAFTVADVIAEVYGYQVARNIIWYGFAGEFLFVVLSLLTMHLPFPVFWKNEPSFNMVFANLPFAFLIGLMTAPIGDFINIYVIVKWKIRFKGRYFILRCILASTLGELVDSIIIGLLLHAVNHWQGDTWTIVFVIFLFKILYSALSAIPAKFVIDVLKKYEGIDVYDYSTQFNPFKLKIQSPH